MKHRTAMLLMTVVLGGACDPDQAAKQSVEAAAKTLEAVEQAKATKKNDFASCMSAVDMQGGISKFVDVARGRTNGVRG